MTHLEELLTSPWLTDEGVSVPPYQEQDQNKQHEDPREEEAETSTSEKRANTNCESRHKMAALAKDGLTWCQCLADDSLEKMVCSSKSRNARSHSF